MNRFVKMASRFVLFILFLSLCKGSFAKVYVNLNINDCANCTLVLGKVVSIKSLDTLYAVLPGKFKKDNTLIKKKYGFHKADNVQVIYSDSLQDYLGSLYDSPSSHLFVFNTKNSLLYMSDLRDLNLGMLQFYSAFDRPMVYNSKNNQDVNFKTVKYERGLFLLTDFFGKVYSMNPLSKKVKLLCENSENFTRDLYKSLYGKQFKKKYPGIKSIMEEAGNYAPNVVSISKPTLKPEVVVAYKLRDYFDKGNGDTLITMDYLFMKINLKTLKKKIFIKDTTDNVLKDFTSIWSLSGTGMKQRGVFIIGRDEAMALADIDFSDSTFSLSNLDYKIRPNDLLKRVKRYAFASNISTYAMMYQYADSVYSIPLKKQIKIPHKFQRKKVDDVVNGSLVYDPNSKLFSLYYFWRPQSVKRKAFGRLMRFDEHSKVISDESIQSVFNKYYVTAWCFVHPYQMVILDGKTNKIVTVDF